MSQPTSTTPGTSEFKPVSDGLAKHMGRIVEDASLKYPGGLAKLELVKGDPDFVEELYKLFEARATKRAEVLAFSERPAWKTITVGTHPNKKDLQKTVETEGHKLSDWAKEVVKNKLFTVETEERKLDLYTATVAELGFPNGAKVSDIYAKLDEFGFGKCPDETALQLRREYTDQPMDEWRIVVSEPLADAYGDLIVLSVVRYSYGSWVYGNYAIPDIVWSGYYRLVFCRK
ncbi:MAG: hypothetical protein NUV80_05150 [Candidatus Berkelbacteria bacterium]|nr:hypothetical protein [Candidatus Berkelbacteria bacterium]MCR4307924.1 hypothetical protein [Candidatus Berkelbacteria bacterium]